MNTRIRAIAALVAVFGLLFAQLAVAAYACPMIGGGGQSLQSQSPTQDGACDGMPMDAAGSGLCHAHCHLGDVSADKTSPAVPDQTSTFVVITPGGLHQAVATLAPGEQRSILARATAPPLAVRHCCLRL